MSNNNEKPDWKVLLIGGGAAVGKTTVAKEIAARYGASILPVDAIWFALKAGTDPADYPAFHYFEPPDEEVCGLPPEVLCERHVKSAEAISETMSAVLEFYLWEQSPAVIEETWITPAAAARWMRRFEGVRAVFIHEPDAGQVLAAMLARAGRDTPRRRVTSKVFWLFGNWVREQALAEGMPVVDAPPRTTMTERVLAAIS